MGNLLGIVRSYPNSFKITFTLSILLNRYYMNIKIQKWYFGFYYRKTTTTTTAIKNVNSNKKKYIISEYMKKKNQWHSEDC